MVDQSKVLAWSGRRWKQKWQDREFDDEFADLHIQYLYAQHTAYRGPWTIEETTGKGALEDGLSNRDRELWQQMQWEACEARANGLVDAGLELPPELSRLLAEAHLGKRRKPLSSSNAALYLFFYRAMRILQIITEDEPRSAKKRDRQRYWSRMVAKVYNGIKPPNADPVNGEKFETPTGSFGNMSQVGKRFSHLPTMSG